MDWIVYFILTSSLATASVVWRTLKQDHPRFGAFIKSLPVVGKPLSCGFCFPMWLTFAALFFINPIEPLGAVSGTSLLGDSLEFVTAWMSVGFGVLTMRFLLVGMQDGAAILAHTHRALHTHDK